jgi:hypothetical protein
MEPIQALTQYKKYHSSEVVKLEFSAHPVVPDRMFAIGHVPCPLNNLNDQVHAFLNGE